MTSSSRRGSSGSWSISEVSALAIKAARGVGMPWGIAEEAGFALRWLTREGAPGVAALCRYLSAYQNASKMSEVQDGPEWVCPLRFGSAISDGGIALPFEQSGVREPLLLLPFLANQATDSRSVVLKMDYISIIVMAKGFTSNIVDTALLISKTDCTISFRPADSYVITQIYNRVNPTESECIATLTRLAHNTYAPATEASRLAGAGAGLSDND